jgi:ubiquitin-conjugating enzyme E2 C
MTLMMSDDKGISAFPESDNLFKWVGTTHGAAGIVYEDLRYKLSLEFPSGYPYNAPTVKFLVPCYHPNMDTQDNICLDILIDGDLSCMMLGTSCSPLNTHAAELWKNPMLLRSTCKKPTQSSSPAKSPDLDCPVSPLLSLFFSLDGLSFP